MEKAYHADELVYAHDWLRLHPKVAIELAHDKHKLVHLVLFRSPQLAWCGAHVTEVRSRRVRTQREHFPVGVCGQCLTAYEGGL